MDPGRCLDGFVIRWFTHVSLIVESESDQYVCCLLYTSDAADE